MILIKNIFIVIMTINMTSCSITTQKGEIVNTDTLSIRKSIETIPEVDLEISLTDTNLNYGDKILLDITLTNNSKIEQKLLFDKPRISTGGPWATTGKVKDINKKMSVLKYENKTILSSEIYTEDDLKDKHYHLKPGETLKGQYELTDIVVFNFSGNSLPKGKYEVQLFYYSNPSNILILEIK